MNIYLKIASRYLFGRKSTNTINLITGISVFGLSVGTAAIIIVLSTFNGIQGLLLDLFNYFNPDLKVELAEGKTFEWNDSLQNAFDLQEGIEVYSATYEEFTLFNYQDRQIVAKLKGVDEDYVKMSRIDSMIIEGEYLLKDENITYAVSGLGISNELGLNVRDRIDGMTVYMPVEESGTGFGEPFNRRVLYPSGSFAIQQEFDHTYVLTTLEMIQSLTEKPNHISAIEIRVSEGADVSDVQKELKSKLGKRFKVLDRYEQQAEFLRIMNIEKWMSFLILTLAALLVAFNLIGAMWMIVLDKKRDFAILQAMGIRNSGAGKIMYYLGGLISVLGIVIGFVIAIVLYLMQKQFALVRVPDSFVMEAYPVELRGMDFLITTIFVLIIGLIASIPAARRAQRIDAKVS